MSEDKNYWLRRLGTGRINRRRFVGGTAGVGLGAAGLALVGCGGGSSGKIAADATATPAPTGVPTLPPKKGGIYNSGTTSAIAGIGPFSTNDAGVFPIALCYNFLFVYSILNPEAGYRYDLATKHVAQADQVTWTFNLRPDAKIAPNKYGVPERPLDADDVKASFDYIGDKANGTNGYAPFASYFDKWDAPDKQTFRLVTKKPYAYTEMVVANNLYCPIVPKEWIAKGTDQMKADAVGGGACRSAANLTRTS